MATDTGCNFFYLIIACTFTHLKKKKQMNTTIQNIIDTVADVTGVPQELMASEDKTSDIVIARKLLVHFCIELGTPTITVSELIRKTSRCVRRLYSESLCDDKRTIYRIYQDKIKERLGKSLLVA